MSSAKEFLKTDIKIDGLKELARFIEQLPQKALKKALRQAVNAGATPIARDARRMAPKLTGTLRKAIKKKVKTYPNGNAIAIVGADRSVVGGGVDLGKGADIKIRRRGRIVPANYIHLIELGVSQHAQPKNKWFQKSGHPGFKGTHFLKRALENNAKTSKQIMEDKMQEVILKEAAKLAGK